MYYGVFCQWSKKKTQKKLGKQKVCLEYKLKCFSSRWFCLSGLNTTVTLCLRQNAFFEFASIQRSAPRLKPPKHFCVVLTK